MPFQSFRLTGRCAISTSQLEVRYQSSLIPKSDLQFVHSQVVEPTAAAIRETNKKSVTGRSLQLNRIKGGRH